MSKTVSQKPSIANTFYFMIHCHEIAGSCYSKLSVPQ